MAKKNVNLSKLKTSWTKYEIVQVLDVVYSVETIQKYLKGEAFINEPILKSFLGINSLSDPIPSYWVEIQKYSDKEKKLFALAALLFTHHQVIDRFANSFSKGNMKGVAIITKEKSSTNLRSALVNSGATDPSYRRQSEVPYDFTPLIANYNIGPLFKQVLLQRFAVCGIKDLENDEFYAYSDECHFPSVLSLTKDQYRNWLEGLSSKEGFYVDSLCMDRFLCINTEIQLSFNDSREVYFLGENGDGKSVLLMAIYLAFNGYRVSHEMDKTNIGRVLSILDKNSKLHGVDNSGHDYSPSIQNKLQNIYAYGTHRGRYSSDNYEEYGFMTLFDNNQELINPEQWIKDLALDKTKQKNQKLGVEALKRVINDILNKDVAIEMDGSRVFFVEKGYRESLDELSEGYRSMIIFVCDLLYRLLDNNPDVDKIFEIPAVVLVDEIDEHLHLKWQRQIVKKLRGIFPNIQFVFTTHSPTIIQGASDDAIIFRVYRERGITRVSAPYYRNDLNDMMVNSLVTSSLFGLANSRMDENNAMSDTSDDFVLYRINKKVHEELDKQKKEGKEFLSDQEIDAIIDKVLKEKNYDKN
ncbi:MAG: AAA family ATPase [Prevotella sp.]|nr:AAA family ATPase [Prevotella sp.]